MAQIIQSQQAPADLSKLNQETSDLLTKNPSLNKLLSSGLSPITCGMYAVHVANFCAYMKMPIEQTIKSYYDWSAIVSDYLISIERTKKLRTRRIILSALNKWFAVNNVHVFDKVSKPLGSLAPRAYPILSKQQLTEMILYCDLPSKVVLAIGVTSALSASQIAGLRLKDVDLSLEIPMIRSKEYRTFITPEARRIVEAFIRLRKHRGETITPESFILGPHETFYRAVDFRFHNALESAGIEGFQFAALKDYFRSWSKVAGLDPLMIQYFCGQKLRGNNTQRHTRHRAFS